MAMARIVLGGTMNIQVPPNLNHADYPLFLLAGINDWGGVSPITIDHVNPEAPWPHLASLRARTEALGFQLKARLPLYPELVVGDGRFVSPRVRHRVRSLADSDGYPKEAHVATF